MPGLSWGLAVLGTLPLALGVVPRGWAVGVALYGNSPFSGAELGVFRSCSVPVLFVGRILGTGSIRVATSLLWASRPPKKGVFPA